MLNIKVQVGPQFEVTGNMNKKHFDDIIEFSKVFMDRCHHTKEEELLFPAMVAAGFPKDSPLAVMLHEHELGRNHIKAVNEAFPDIAGAISFCKGYYAKYTRLYFVAARSYGKRE